MLSIRECSNKVTTYGSTHYYKIQAVTAPDSSRCTIRKHAQHHISSLHSNFWVQLSTGSPFLPTDKNGKFLQFFNIIIRECGSTLSTVATCGSTHNTKVKPLLLPTQAVISYKNTYKHRVSYFKSKLAFLGPAKHWQSISAARLKPEILAFLHHQYKNNNNNNKDNKFQDLLFSQLRRDFSTLRIQILINLYQTAAIFLKYMLLALLSCLLKYLGF